jgi:hypothetical protein
MKFLVLTLWVDITVGVVVGALFLAIAIFLGIAYYRSPCGICRYAKECTKVRKKKSPLLSSYHSCFKEDVEMKKTYEDNLKKRKEKLK